MSFDGELFRRAGTGLYIQVTISVVLNATVSVFLRPAFINPRPMKLCNSTLFLSCLHFSPEAVSWYECYLEKPLIQKALAKIFNLGARALS